MSEIKQEVLLGNEAVARGMVEAGCHVVSSYPGTPSSEILPGVVRFKIGRGQPQIIKETPRGFVEQGHIPAHVHMTHGIDISIGDDLAIVKRQRFQLVKGDDAAVASVTDAAIDNPLQIRIAFWNRRIFHDATPSD